MQIYYDERYPQITRLEDKRAWPWLLLFNSGISPQYLRNGESYKLSKVVNGDDRISGQSLHRGSGAERIVGELVRREVRGLSPETNHLHNRRLLVLE